jgi:hypothetical protein
MRPEQTFSCPQVPAKLNEIDGKRQSVRDFHLFLKYAETGVLADREGVTGRPNASPFETQLEVVLQRTGFQTERQVGVAGYFVDLAVKQLWSATRSSRRWSWPSISPPCLHFVRSDDELLELDEAAGRRVASNAAS